MSSERVAAEHPASHGGSVHACEEGHWLCGDPHVPPGLSMSQKHKAQRGLATGLKGGRTAQMGVPLAGPVSARLQRLLHSVEN